MTDAPPRRRARAPILSLIDHAASPPPRGYPPNMPPERPPVRRNLFGSQISSRMGSSTLPSAQPSPELPPSFMPNPDTFQSRDPTRRPRALSTSSEESIDIEEEEMEREREMERQSRIRPPQFRILADGSGGHGQAGPSHNPPPAPRMGRLAPMPMRGRARAGTQRMRRSEEDDIVVRDLSGDIALSDPFAMIMPGRRVASTTHGHEEFGDGPGHGPEEEASDSDDEAAEERKERESEEAERHRIAEAIKHHQKEKSKEDDDCTALLESVKARIKDMTARLEDDEWMFSAGEHK